MVRKSLFTAALVVALVPAAAFADGWEHRHRDEPCAHPASGVPAGQPTNSGHYETRTTQQWVPGFYETVFVPGVCQTRQHRWRTVTRCSQGGYQQVYRDGHYVAAQEQVWVAAYAYAPAPPPAYQPSGWRASAGTSHAGTQVSFTVGGRF